MKPDLVGVRVGVSEEFTGEFALFIYFDVLEIKPWAHLLGKHSTTESFFPAKKLSH